MSRIIPLSRGYMALVDAEDFAYLSQFRWFVKISTNTGRPYAWRHTKKVKGRSEIVYMHRDILGLTKGDGLQGDHRNREQTLDNRRSNLRIATPSQNRMNGSMRADNSTGYRGVSYHAKIKRWVAEISAGNKRQYIGCFTEPETAYAAYCEAAKALHGEFNATSRHLQRTLPRPLPQG